ncbi:MAG: bifunctional riboflavin kinase/FAD synthetase [Pseudomonadota bacterium]
MRVFRGIPARALNPTALTPTALTIGNFDGLHLGHQAMLARLIAAAREQNLPAAVMTFEPHPREFFRPDNAPTRLTNLREKLELLSKAGVDHVYVCHFNRAFSQISADDFVTHILHERLAIKWLLVGDDFQFGAKRIGNSGILADYAPKLGFTFSAMPSLEVNDKRVSSTLVREALAAGDLVSAQQYLGRPYSISGRVIHGEKIGRSIGFPTANVQLKHNRPPVKGIFAVKLYVSEGVSFAGVASLGTRPTVSSSGKWQLEVHVFDFADNLYGQHVRVEFLHKLRDEAFYPDMQTLIAQIARDVENAKAYFESLRLTLP